MCVCLCMCLRCGIMYNLHSHSSLCIYLLFHLPPSVPLSIPSPPLPCLSLPPSPLPPSLSSPSTILVSVVVMGSHSAKSGIVTSLLGLALLPLFWYATFQTPYHSVSCDCHMICNSLVFIPVPLVVQNGLLKQLQCNSHSQTSSNKCILLHGGNAIW